jgi:hypothetical protein
MKRKTNFDEYLEEQLRDKDFCRSFQESRRGVGSGVETGRIEEKIRIVSEGTGKAGRHNPAAD